MAAKKKTPKVKPWKPFVPPTRPPAGTFDPALDQQERAAARGIGDLRMDVERDTARSTNDFTTATGEVERNRGEGLADLMLSRSRGLQDLDRRYDRMGSAQLQGINAAGALHGGALAASMRRRAENRAFEEGRFTEDIGRSQGRIVDAAQRDLGRLGLSNQRATEDRTQGLARAERENTFLGQDVNESRMFQAKAAGWIPDEKPKGEGQQAGINYRWLDDSRKRAALTTGRVVGRDDLLAKIKRARAKLAAGPAVAA